jgi:hypothetical protein
VNHKFFPAIGIFISSFIFLGSWALSSPIGSSPDEGSHLVGIWCTEINKSVKCNNSEGPSKFSSQLSGDESCYLYDADQSAGCLQSQEEVYKELSGFNEIKFYNFLNSFVSDNIIMSVIIMRFINVFILSVCIVFAFIYLRKDIFVGTVFSFMTVGLPLGFYLVTSINTTSWVILGSIFFIPYIFEIVTNLSVRTIPLIIVTMLLTYIYLGSRPDGILFLGISIVSSIPILAYKIKNFNFFIKMLKYNNLSRVVISLISLITLYLIYFVSTEIGKRASLGLYASTQNVTNWDIGYRFTSLISGALGGWGLGSLEVDMPGVVSVSSLFIFFSVIFISLGKSVIHSKLTLLIYAYFLIFVIWIFLFKSQLFVGQWLQPRYILPIMFGLMSTSFVGIRQDLDKTFIYQIKIFIFLSTVCFAIGQHTLLRRYTHGLDELYLNLDQNKEWWWNFLPISPMQLLMIGTISYFATWLILLKRLNSNQELIQLK